MHLPAPEFHRAFWLLSPMTVIIAHLFWDLLPICTISASELKVGILTWLGEECLMTSLLKALPLKGLGTHSMSWEGQLSFLLRLAQPQPPPLSAPQCQTWLRTLNHTHYQTQLHWSWHDAFVRNCLCDHLYPIGGHCVGRMAYGDGPCWVPPFFDNGH